MGDLVTHLLQAARQDSGVGGNALGNALEALRSVIDRVHAGNHGRQHLRGADVGGGLFAANVLFARLQRQPIAGVAVNIDADTDQTARQRAL